ncbi:MULTISPECIES: type II toxin-antitoxin system RelE/ParE family toxin [Photorhabdus]|uniref:Addiction module killer protein n=1 Tax=Photorhabdus khanii subsp. guanajuatensis TaxID=2100166 RepID=A0A4R4JFH7_9GAMM|nr:type II toxin-antitoxin system RelE/ParE family toxin [Photorhabdus khanii]TDB52302.1 addiction module killer protein [Photorhabdus khanii subsp. guanajuatensis]
MRYRIERYQDRQGNVPFTDWITKLRKKHRQAAAKIDNQIDRAEAGNFGDHKFARDGVWEMRINFGTGYRIYYSVEGEEIVILLLGGDKKTQDKDIDTAIEYLQDYKARKPNENEQN